MTVCLFSPISLSLCLCVGEAGRRDSRRIPMNVNANTAGECVCLCRSLCAPQHTCQHSQYVGISACMSVFQYISHSCLFVSQSVCATACLSVNQSISLSVILFISVYLPAQCVYVCDTISFAHLPLPLKSRQSTFILYLLPRFMFIHYHF